MKFTLILLSSALMIARAAPFLAKRTSGFATYYDVGLGSCGEDSSNDEMVAAVNPVHIENGKCGEMIYVETDQGSVSVRVVDKCPACDENTLDLSPAAFDQIGDQARGRISVDWHWD